MSFIDVAKGVNDLLESAHWMDKVTRASVIGLLDPDQAAVLSVSPICIDRSVLLDLIKLNRTLFMTLHRPSNISAEYYAENGNAVCWPHFDKDPEHQFCEVPTLHMLRVGMKCEEECDDGDITWAEVSVCDNATPAEIEALFNECVDVEDGLVFVCPGMMSAAAIKTLKFITGTSDQPAKRAKAE